jgi:glycosyltransferase involved in cell wall biosynthesis
MRVLHVIPSLSPTSGGPSFALPAMARALSGYDVQVIAAATDDDGRGKHLSGIPLGKIIPQDGWGAVYFRKQTEFYKCSLPLRSWLRRHVRDYDAVHIHAVFSFASLAAGRAAASAGVPYIVRPLGVLNRWGMENRRRLVKALSFRFFDLPMLRKAAAMHYTSRMELEDAARFGLTNLQRVIPIGMDLTPFDALPPREVFSARFPETASTRNILFLSRIDEKKGIDLLLEGFARIAPARPDIRLVLCGGGDPALTEKLHFQATSLGIGDRVTWAGQVTGELRLAAFSAAEMFVLPSHSENFGIALLEAMAAGLPCLSTDQVALAADAVRDKAVLLTSREPAAIAAKLEELLDSPEERHLLGQSARILSRCDYSLPAMGKALHSLYREIVKN